MAVLGPTPSKGSSAPTVPGARASGSGLWARRIVAALLIVTGFVTLVYTCLSITIATQLADQPSKALQATPASLGLDYRNVTFPSREDHLTLSGWFIPGVLPDGSLTATHTIIMVHGFFTNRVDPQPDCLI